MKIFKEGSKTYYNSSFFFPTKIRNEVAILYAFVRVADNFVDAMPQQTENFTKFKEDYYKARSGKKTKNQIVNTYHDLEKKYKFSPEWSEHFLESMEMDTKDIQYVSMADTEKYMFGSAEVIGLMMVKILQLPSQAQRPAQYLGKAMQYINFIRDIGEDQIRNRCYFPKKELQKHNLKSLKEQEIGEKPKEYEKFLYDQVEYYKEWQKIGESGFKHIPKRVLIPIKTASDMYNWTARQIQYKPLNAYQNQIKPSKNRIYTTAAINAITM